MDKIGLRILSQEEMDLADNLQKQGVISLRGKMELRMLWARQKAPLNYVLLMFGIYVFLTFGSIVSAFAIFQHTPVIMGLDTIVFGMVAGIILVLILLYDRLGASFFDTPDKVMQYKNMLLLDKDFHEDLTNLLGMFAIFLPLYALSGHMLTGVLLGIVVVVTANILEESRAIVLPSIIDTMENELFFRSAWTRRGNREAD